MARKREDQPAAAPPARALVASARRIDLRTPGAAARQIAKRKEWQDEGWAYFDEVPEVKYGCLWASNQLAKLRLFVAVLDPNDLNAEPVPVDSDQADINPELAKAAQMELARLRAPVGGLAEILRVWCVNNDVAGDCYLIGREERTGTDAAGNTIIEPETWDIRSISEVSLAGKTISVLDEDGKKVALDPQRDAAIRLWQRHPRFAHQADSFLRGVLNDARALLVLANLTIAEAHSRMNAGILLVPNGLSTGASESESAEEFSEEGSDEQDPFMAELAAGLTAPLEDPSNAASVVPVIIRGEKEELGAMQHLKLGRDTGDSIDKKIESHVRRVARGMNLPLEAVEGHMGTTFANAAQIHEDKWQEHLEPRAVAFCDQITDTFLRANLLENYPASAEEIARLVVWYDPGALISEADLEANADKAFEMGTISEESYRRAKGFDDDDAPTPIEQITRALLLRGRISDPGVIQELMEELLGYPIVIEEPAAAPATPDIPPPDVAPVPPEQAVAAAYLRVMQRRASKSDASLTRKARSLAGRSESNPGRRLMEIDRELRTRLLVLADRTMERTLEKAGSRVKNSASRGTRDLVANVPPLLACAHLGKTLVAAGGITEEDLLAGAFDAMQEQFMAWGAQSQEQALELVNRLVGGFSGAERDRLGLRQAADLDEAWGWMKDALMDLARARLYDPAPAAPLFGEFDASMRVPPGLIRQAVARAGGAARLDTSTGQDAWLALTNGGSEPAGGIGTGDLLGQEMADQGVSIEGYVWDYGPAARMRPFEPHLELDGVTFQNFDDDVLANTEGFPDGDYFMPGDHDGSLVAGTMVSGPAARGASLRHWRGDLIDLSFASGQFLSATPNHPILTGRGWIAAGLLEEGDEVVRCTDAEGVAALVPDDCQMPARIEDVVAAVAVVPGVVARRVKVSPVNFHGDGEGSEIAIVWTDGLLRDGHDSALGQPRSQDALAVTDADLSLLPGDGGAGQFFEGVGDSALGSVSGAGHSGALLGRPQSVHGKLGGGEAAPVNTGSQEPLLDGVAIDAEALRERVLGLAPHVEFDKVLHVDLRSGFSGHVYDLQTEGHWYLANGIVAHNCLCDFTPVLLGPGEAEG